MKKAAAAIISLLSVVMVLCCFAVTPDGADRVEGNSVLASVDGQAVTLMDVLPVTRNRELQARSVYSGDKLLEVISGYRKKAVDEMIDNILIHKEFARYKYELPNQEVEREIDRFAVRIGCRSRSQLNRRLKKEGSSVDEVRMVIRKNMMVQMMLYRQIRIADPVSPKEAYEYFQANEEKFAAPERFKIGMFKLDNSVLDYRKRCAEITAMLNEDPAAFEKLEEKFGISSGSVKSWDVTKNDLRPEFVAAFKKFSSGTVSSPVEVYDGTVWLLIKEYHPAEKKSFRDVEERIKAELELKIRENVIDGYAKKLRSKALVEYFF